MNSSRIKIDLNKGIVECEGSEALAKQIYEDFKDKLPAHEARVSRPQRVEACVGGGEFPKGQEDDGSVVAASSSRRRKTRSRSSPPKILTDFDVLSEPSIATHYESYRCDKVPQKFLIVLEYLLEVKSLEALTIDHIFTCFNALEIDAENNFRTQFNNARRAHFFVGAVEEAQITPLGRKQLKTLRINAEKHED